MSRHTYIFLFIFYIGFSRHTTAQDSMFMANKKRIEELKARVNKLYSIDDTGDSVIYHLRLIVQHQRDSLKLLTSILYRGDYPAKQNGFTYTSACNCERIYYGLGKHRANYSTYPKLDSIALLVRRDQTLKLKLVGHTDKNGITTDNYLLSTQRAENLKTYLANKYLIDPDRILTEGRGSSEHIKEITDPYLFHLDRRVEVFIVRQR